jgi:hypothetical protein
VKVSDPIDALVTTSFGNIIELGSKGLILESGRELDLGLRLRLDVVFPGQPRGDDPFAHLHCVVRKVQNPSNLHYDLQIVELNERSRERLSLYLTQKSGGR